MATGETSSSTVDAKIWGELQNYIDLKIIYGKLPIREFFQLRLVCKEWNRLASDRTFLEDSFKDPIPKPYFIVTAFSAEQQGLLSYEASSRGWTWTRLPSRWSGHFEDTGMLLCSNTYEVFNVHTRCFYRLPLALELTPKLPYAGMILDSSVSPRSFQIILGSNDIHTQIYDSGNNSWTGRLSKRSYDERVNVVEPTISCVCCNGVVYLMSCADYVEVLIETYDLEKDEWGTLRPPGLGEDVMNYLGAWQGSHFFFKVDSSFEHLIAWVLADRSRQEWKVYDRMPEDLFSWVTYADHGSSDPSDLVTFLTRFCHEYVLVYTDNKLDDSWLRGRCVLFRLDTKAWEKFELAENLGLAVWSRVLLYSPLLCFAFSYSTAEKLVVIGGDYIGLEMGSVWGWLGSQVTVVEFGSASVPSMDAEVRKSFQWSLEKQKMNSR